MGKLELNDLLKLVQQLSNGYRIVFNMYAIEGYSHKEIAKELGISEGASKSQLSRARAILKDKIIFDVTKLCSIIYSNTLIEN
jgi:RNA polymerase sigma-70 factor (ECF subfamily)